MSDFSTSGLLELSVSQSSLTSAKSTIQSELGDVEVDVTASASDQLNPQNQRPADNGGALSQQLLSNQTERIGTVTDQLTENLDLNETRNDLLRTLIDETERAGRRAARGGGGGMGGGALGVLALAGGAGALGLSGLSDQLGNIDLPELTVPDLPELEVPEIPPIPVTVPNIPPLDVPDIPPITVPDIPPVAVPDIPPLDVPEIPPVSVIAPDFIPVAAPDSIPVTLPSPDIGAGEAIAGGTVAAGGAGAAWLARQGGQIGSVAGGAASGAALPGISAEMIPDEIGSELAPGEELAPSILSAEGRATRLGGVGEWLNKQLGTPADQEQVDRIRGDSRQSSAGVDMSGVTGKLDQLLSNIDSSGGDVTIDHTSTYELGDLRELRQSQQDDIRELEDQLNDLERQLRRGRR